MHVILATEIWGATQHVQDLARQMKQVAKSVEVIDPYDGSDPAFTSEDEAYATFLERCGHDAFFRRVLESVDEASGPAFLLGFSVGAGAVWSTACAVDEGILGAACFYGSAIRNMTDLVPKVPVDVILPGHESHFDVCELARALEGKPNTRCHMTTYGHGFMNQLSANYDAEGYAYWSRWIEGILISLSKSG